VTSYCVLYDINKINESNITIFVRKTIVCFLICYMKKKTHYMERKLRVFENMVFRRIFGPRRDEVTGGMEETA